MVLTNRGPKEQKKLRPLNMQKFSNKVKTLQQLCEECLIKRFTSEEQFEKGQGERMTSSKVASPYIQPIFGNTLMKMMLEEPETCTGNDVLEMYSESNKFGVQQVAVRNKKISHHLIEKFLLNQQSLAHLKMCYCKIDGCMYVEPMLPLCKEHLITFHLQSVYIETYHEGCSILENYHDLSRTRHPNLKCLRLSGMDCAWVAVINKNDVPLINFLELSQYYKQEAPKETKRLVEELEKDQNFSDLNFQSLSDQNCVLTFRNPLLQLYRINLMKSTLKSLVLHNTTIGDWDLQAIYELQHLELLDLSMSVQSTPGDPLPVLRPQVKFHHLVERFPKLRSIDLSSTDIGNNIYVDALDSHQFWKVFENRKLDFLGLLDCTGADFYGVYHIANEVSGCFSVVQLLTAMERSMDRIPELIYISKRLYLQHIESTPEHKVLAIKLLMEAVHRYPTNETLLTNLCVNIYGMMRSDYCHFNLFQKREMIRLLVDIISDGETLPAVRPRVIRVALLSLEFFTFPDDCGSDFDYVVDKLTKILLEYSEDDLGKLAIHVCNIIVCTTNHDVKSMLSQTNFVEAIMGVINKKLHLRACDEVMTLCWATLWNVSDETPDNSHRFIQLGGLTLLWKAYDMFDDNDDLHKSIVGLLGNIAEIDGLRKFFFEKPLLEILLKWCDRKNSNDDIELSYHACGTLSHLLSDGADAWTVDSPTRDEARLKVFNAVNSWNLEAQRQVNYRSFLPILRLVHCQVKEASHWAVWALCNLLKFDGDYRRTLEREGAIPILSRVKHGESFYDSTVVLARNVIQLMMAGQHSSGFPGQHSSRFVEHR